MLIALAFAHCSSELLFKEQIIIPVKKTLNNAGHINAKLIDFSEICQKKSSEIGCFLLIVSWRSFPPQISREIGRFFREFAPENPSKFGFLLVNPSEIGWFFWEFRLVFPAKIPRNRPIFPRICPWKSREIWLFFPRNIRSPEKDVFHSHFHHFGLNSLSGSTPDQWMGLKPVIDPLVTLARKEPIYCGSTLA